MAQIDPVLAVISLAQHADNARQVVPSCLECTGNRGRDMREICRELRECGACRVLAWYRVEMARIEPPE